jgi:cysteinyl-tRNA synthetase
MISLYNSLTQKKEQLVPINPGRVSLYSCGPTVYDEVHLGNLRSFLLPDLIQRTLRHLEKIDVEWVMNITDVDDKMIVRSKEEFPGDDEPTALGKLADKYTDIFLDDIEAIGIERDDVAHLPRATDYMQQIKELIQKLISDGIAYESEGSIYFSVEKYQAKGKKYGRLVDLDFSAKPRITDDQDQKEGVADFALWKARKPGEPFWTIDIDGHELEGRPGWHIECSAMSTALLGGNFDIHTGGVDLKFPHHENELAQCGGVQANFYIHNEHMSIDSEKMSKSLGNIKTIRDVKYPLAFRLLVLSGHYRSQMEFSMDDIKSAQDRITKLQSYFDQVMLAREGLLPVKDESGAVEKFSSEFRAALEDDLNTPRALAALSHIEGKVFSEDAKAALRLFDDIFGFQLVFDLPLHDNILEAIDQYETARENKDFKKSDNLRQDLLNQYGLVLSDTPVGALVHREKQ